MSEFLLIMTCHLGSDVYFAWTWKLLLKSDNLKYPTLFRPSRTYPQTSLLEVPNSSETVIPSPIQVRSHCDGNDN